MLLQTNIYNNDMAFSKVLVDVKFNLLHAWSNTSGCPMKNSGKCPETLEVFGIISEKCFCIPNFKKKGMRLRMVALFKIRIELLKHNSNTYRRKLKGYPPAKG